MENNPALRIPRYNEHPGNRDSSYIPCKNILEMFD